MPNDSSDNGVRKQNYASDLVGGRKGGPRSPEDAMGPPFYLNGSSGTQFEDMRGRQSGFLKNFE